MFQCLAIVSLLILSLSLMTIVICFSTLTSYYLFFDSVCLSNHTEKIRFNTYSALLQRMIFRGNSGTQDLSNEAEIYERPVVKRDGNIYLKVLPGVLTSQR